MCGCTLYDSPTCGHTWLSMSSPCGFLSDLLSCPQRSVYQTLIAPAHTCPICNGGFADAETIEMVQGPWGCNQMIRNTVGGPYSIPGQWGPALTSGMGAFGGLGGMSGMLHDHRLTGPYGPGAMIAGPGAMVSHSPLLANGPMMGGSPLLVNSPMMANGAMMVDSPLLTNTSMIAHGPTMYDGYDSDDGYYYLDSRGRRRQRKERSKYKYRYTDKAATNCIVM